MFTLETLVEIEKIKVKLTCVNERQKILQNVSVDLIEQNNDVLVGGVSASVAVDRKK